MVYAIPDIIITAPAIPSAGVNAGEIGNVLLALLLGVGVDEAADVGVEELTAAARIDEASAVWELLADVVMLDELAAFLFVGSMDIEVIELVFEVEVDRVVDLVVVDRSSLLFCRAKTALRPLAPATSRKATRESKNIRKMNDRIADNIKNQFKVDYDKPILL